MQKIFQHIRRQPKSVRDNYALGIAGVFTFSILCLWLISKTGGEESDNIAAPKAEVPFATLIKQTKEQFAALKATLTESGKETQVAASVEATGSSTNADATNFILDPNTIEAVRSKDMTAISSTSTKVYQEVLIGTTTDISTAIATPTQQ